VTTTILRGRRYDTAQCVEVAVDDGRISSVTALADTAELPWLAPGFIDLQVNGYRGIGFNDPALTPEKVAEVSLLMDQFGVTRYLPTLTTDSLDLLSQSLATIAKAINNVPAVRLRVPGIHLEGPFISAEDGPRGAHPKQHVRPPDWDAFQRLQQIAGGYIRLTTLSAEYDESPSFISKAVGAGVVVAIGHTKATTDQIRAAVDAGARLSTHLGNGSHPLIRRHPNYIWDQLAEDQLMASLIVDGHHLPPAVVKAMVRAKSPERCILVSDKTNLGGLPSGIYSTPLGDIELLPDGKPVLAGQCDILAGAALPLSVNIAKVIEFADVDLPTAIDMATRNPARLMNWPVPFLEVGTEANLVAFRYDSGKVQIDRVVHELPGH
jgi:N-acetylglucosamine-6-phosphate deacetylase